MMLGDFHFIRPWWLLLVPLAIVFWRMQGKALDPMKAWRSVIDADLLEAQTVGRDESRKRRSVLLLTGWILGAIALARIRIWRTRPSEG